MTTYLGSDPSPKRHQKSRRPSLAQPAWTEANERSVLAKPPPAAQHDEAVRTVLRLSPTPCAKPRPRSRRERKSRTVTRAKKEGFHRGTMGSPVGVTAVRTRSPRRACGARATR